MNPNPSTHEAGMESAHQFQFLTVKQAYEAPQLDVDFLVDGLLPAGSLSALVGKPKAGKTTMARQLAVAVAHGTPFLGRATQQGAVLYLGIEEKLGEVVAHFQQLGLCESDPVLIRCGAVKKDEAVEQLKAVLRDRKDVKLVIIDPIFRFMGKVTDANEYVPVNNALEVLMELARNHNVHIMALHHMKKKKGDDVIDGTLGSTAITGGVDSALMLEVEGGGVRTLCSRQRYGTDMPPTQLTWSQDSRELSLGLSCEEADREAAEANYVRIEQDMVAYVTANPGCEQQAMLNAVRGKRALKLRAMQKLEDCRMFVKSGGGKKGDPYHYSLAAVPSESPNSAGQTASSVEEVVLPVSY